MEGSQPGGSHRVCAAPAQASGTQGSGGGMALTNLVSMSVTNCVFERNHAGTAGGGMWLTGLSNSVITVDNCT